MNLEDWSDLDSSVLLRKKVLEVSVRTLFPGASTRQMGKQERFVKPSLTLSQTLKVHERSTTVPPISFLFQEEKKLVGEDKETVVGTNFAKVFGRKPGVPRTHPHSTCRHGHPGAGEEISY